MRSRRQLNSPLVAAMVAGLVAALAACSGKSNATEEAREEVVEGSTSRPGALAVQDLRFPLDDYEPTAQEQRTLDEAQGVLLKECMARLGFHYTPPKPSPVADDKKHSRVFGLLDLNVASKYGYGPQKESEENSSGEVRPARTEAERTALVGASDLSPGDLPASQEEAERKKGGPMINGRVAPVGGCTRESFLKLYAPRPGAVDIMFAFSLKREAESRSVSDGRGVKVDGRWSVCMKDAGFSVRNPRNPMKDLGISQEDSSGPEAVRAAVADVKCKERVDFAGIHYSIQSEYQRALIRDNRKTLESAGRQLRDRIELAAAVLKKGQ
ncbi:hypothetical protein ACIQ9E_24725 [Streptomyces sp. NPDC094448]|uniref:hypothetical protein n=1 Tax=Streptomyces sp. NPDC094448 TaxID=3366063 RepID=UPI0037F41EF4